VRSRILVGSALLLTLGAAVPGAQPASPPSRIGAMRCGDSTAAVAARPALAWQAGAPGVRWTRWPVALGDRGVRVTFVVVEIDPARVALSLEIAREGNALAPWSVELAPDSAVVAFNAGQFTDAGPWGWVVHRGREWQAPASGPYAGAFAIDSAGVPVVLGAQALAAARARGGWREVLQSYPHVLAGGRATAALCGAAPVDASHRDIRLAIGTRADGRILLVLSRYAAVGAIGERMPIGPTTAETAEGLRQLGARDALMLDGGLSAQLLLRTGRIVERWDGLRRVPLALIGVPRS